MHVPFRLPLPKAVAVGSASPHGRLQEGQLVQSWVAVRDSWRAAGRTNYKIRKTLCIHFTSNRTYVHTYTHEQLQQHESHCTINSVPYTHHCLVWALSSTLTPTAHNTPTYGHTHTPSPPTNIRTYPSNTRVLTSFIDCNYKCTYYKPLLLFSLPLAHAWLVKTHFPFQIQLL